MNLLSATLICTGLAPTSPVTRIEVEMHPGEHSSIRYEIAEGSLEGTAYIQSLGMMTVSRKKNFVIYQSGDDPNSTVLSIRMHRDQIVDSHFTHHISGMKNVAVDCEKQD